MADIELGLNDSFLKSAITGLSAAGTKKFQIAKELILLSEKNPEKLYPHIEALIPLLEAQNKIIQWGVFRIIANLAAADKEDRIGRIIGRYLAPIRGPVMITAANAIRGAAIIAGSHQHLSRRIVQAILQVESAKYQTDECRNVAIGHAIKALGTMGNEVRYSTVVRAFVKRQTENSRAGTRKKAERFLKRIRERVSGNRPLHRTGRTTEAEC